MLGGAAMRCVRSGTAALLGDTKLSIVAREGYGKVARQGLLTQVATPPTACSWCWQGGVSSAHAAVLKYTSSRLCL